MGYRSQVKILVSKKGFYELKKYVDKTARELQEKMKTDYDFNLLKHSDQIRVGDDQVTVSWDYVKWYEGSFEDVDAIMDGLEILKNNGYSYRFCRVGEDIDDLEETNYDGEKDDTLSYLYIERYIEDIDGEEKKYEDFDNLNGGF